MAQIFDDGSSIETFDDGSTVVTASDGAVSSTPAIPTPITASPNNSQFVGPPSPFSSPNTGSANNGAKDNSASNTGFLSSIRNLFNPSSTRLNTAGLNLGGSQVSYLTKTPTVNINTQAGTPKSADWRVRISLPAGFNKSLFNSQQYPTLQKILDRTNGVVFPYTPTVTVTHNARYQEQALTHSNYKNYFYEGSDVAAITISGDFTVQNIDDGQYLLSCIYFLRSCTKMFFGNDSLAGTPPPMVYLDGYGSFYLPHVSCVITSFQHTMPDGVDYLEIPMSSGTVTSPNKNAVPSTGTVRLPTASQLQVTLQPVYSRAATYNRFTLGQFAQGALLGS